MPLKLVPIMVVRRVSTVSATFGLSAPVETLVAGSPFWGRVYRTSQKSFAGDEAAPGTATVDEMQRMSILDPACPVQVGDVAFLPRADGSFTRAKIIRPRYYSDRVQFDLETGAEGDAAPPAAALDIAEQGYPEATG